MASYSNIGSCLSIFAPGSSIVSAGNGGDTEVGPCCLRFCLLEAGDP